MNTAEDLRSSPRLPRKETDLWQININYDELITHDIKDLSVEGLSFNAPKDVHFEVGQIVDVHIRLDRERVFEVKAKIVWVGNQQFGLKFPKAPHPIEAYIKNALHSLAAKIQGSIPTF